MDEQKLVSFESGTSTQNKRHCTSPGDNKNGRHYENYKYKRECRSPSRKKITSAGTFNYKSYPVSNTILIKFLPKFVNERYIFHHLKTLCLVPKDIRLTRRQKTGTSKGLAFVEFRTTSEAKKWMNVSKGIWSLANGNRIYMKYCTSPKTTDSSWRPKERPIDIWFCNKCSTLNYAGRYWCFKCKTSWNENKLFENGNVYVCSTPTKILLLRNLDVITSEESVMSFLEILVPNLVIFVSKIYIKRDPINHLSEGICFIESDNLDNSIRLFESLRRLPKLEIDNKTVLVSYCKCNADVGADIKNTCGSTSKESN